MGSQLAKEQE